MEYNFPEELPLEDSLALQAKLVQCIQYSLAHFLIKNAIFLAERLYATVKNDYTLNVLATCYYRSGKPQQCYSILHSSLQTPENRYLFALSCFDLGKYPEAEFSLLHSSQFSSPTNFILPENNEDNKIYFHESTRKELLSQSLYDEVPNGGAGLLLLGQIYQRRGQINRAIRALRRSLQLNPFLFQSFLLLSQLGDEELKTNDYFSKEDVFDFPSFDDPSADLLSENIILHNIKNINNNNNINRNIHTNSRTISSTPFLTPFMIDGNLHHIPSPSPSLSPFLSTFQSKYKQNQPIVNPITPIKPITMNSNLDLPPPIINNDKNRINNNNDNNNNNNNNNLISELEPMESTPIKAKGKTTTTSVASKGKVGTAAPKMPSRITTRTSAKSSLASLDQSSKEQKLNSQKLKIKEKKKDQTKETPSTSSSSFSSLLSSSSLPPSINVIGEETMRKGGKILLSLLSMIGKAYQSLCVYQCKEAISLFEKLPYAQYNTGWVLTQIGKAHMELVDYIKGKAVFERVRKMEPYRIDGMEIYSTILWHLRKEIELSYLAHELIEFDRFSPQCWCVVGNCFSLQRDHETALKIFKRAIYLDPSFTYAYTLSGHEYIANDDLDKAAVCFRNAIHTDERHYNAWYGLGYIYFRQEKFDMAEYHFTKAININISNSVLYCYKGMVKQAVNKHEEALILLQYSLELCPKNNMSKFKIVRSLTALRLYLGAIEILTDIVDHAPKEAQIYFIIGKLYKRLNQTDKALMNLTIAMDLDAKNANYIKSVIDKLDQPDDDSDDVFELSSNKLF